MCRCLFGAGEQLQILVRVIHSYCWKWRPKANVSKSTVMYFAKGFIERNWKRGNRICLGNQKELISL